VWVIILYIVPYVAHAACFIYSRDMDAEGIFGISKSGKQTFILNGFEYYQHRINADGNKVWRCCKARSIKCKASLVCDGPRVLKVNIAEHNHEGNVAKALSRKAVGEMKKKMSETLAGSSATQGMVCSTLPPSVLMALPKKSSLGRVLRRHQQKVLASGDIESALPPCPTDMTFEIPQRFRDFVLYDSGAGPNRLLILGCDQLLDGLARSLFWLADGTFKVVPALFFQLYSIHFQFVAGINPAAVYFLLPNKTRETYDRMLVELRRLIPTANPNNVLVDFESATMGAFRVAFPNARVSGCYFHLSQSILRKVNEIGLKVQYERNDEVRGSIRCLAALAHVPVDDVMESFEFLSESMPEVEKMDELLSYFEHTYIRGRRLRGRGDNYGPPVFAIESWNQREAAAEGIARTTNSVEGWHHGLQALFQCSHPTMWKFLAGLQRDCVKQQASFLQGVTGVEQPSVKRYRILRDRVMRAVATYGQTDILTYLRSIAYLSHN
jgi:hypothetical protein